MFTFNDFCFTLNQLGLSALVAVLRRIVAMVLPTTFGEYTQTEGRVRVNGDLAYETTDTNNAAGVTGYKGWVETPLGVVAFVQDDGALTYRW